MIRKQDTSQAGSRAESANANGRNSHDHERGDDGPSAEWSPGVMLGHDLDADRDEIIRDVVDGDAWEALRAFKRRFDVDLNAETSFADLDAVPPQVWEACGLEPPDHRAVAEFVADYAYPLPDPQETGEGLKAVRAQRYRERDRAAKQLRPEGIAPATEYALSEVGRVCGTQAAEEAEEAIEQRNGDVWNTARPHKLIEQPYLVTAADLVAKLGVSAAQVAAMNKATAADRSAALDRLATARKAHLQRIDRKARSMAIRRKPLADVIRHVTDMVQDEPTATIVGGLLYEQMVIHWVGDGGTYKTFTVLALACSVAAGRDYTHQLTVPERLPVLYLCAERRHYGLGADVEAWCQVNQVDIASLEFLGWDDVVQLGDDEWMAELTEFVVARGIKLIVFDTQRKATRGMEENSATDMSTALANAQRLAVQADAAVIVIHHTARGQSHARGSSVGRDDTDATVLQQETGPNEAEFIIDKHKSEATGTRYSVRAETVTGTVPPSQGRAGYGYTTLVARPRDPLSVDETAARMHAALEYDDKILVAVVNDNDGPALSPAEVERQATARGCSLKKDAVARHLHRLSKPGYGLIAETVNPMNGRKAYGPNISATPPDAADGDTADAYVVKMATRRSSARAKPSNQPDG